MRFAISSVVVCVAMLLACTGDGETDRAPAYALPDSLPPGVTGEMVARGYDVFHGEGLCVTCHGDAAAGKLGPSLADSVWWHAAGSFEAIQQVVTRGISEEHSLRGDEMPARGGEDLSDAQVAAVSAWVWRVSHPVEATLPEGVTQEMIDAGYDVFHDAGACTDCHGEDAGGDDAPSLTDRDWIHARANYRSIVDQIKKGVPFERSRSGVVMPPRGGSTIDDEDVEAVAAYVWVISRGSAR